MDVKRNHFTLVELLVVVGLISLLLGLMVPAFNRMMSGNKVADAASNLKLGLEQAQSYAVSRRSYVALILPNSSSADTDDADEQAALLGGFRLAEVEKMDRDTTEATFKQWIDDFPWKARSEGAVLIYCKNLDGDNEPKTTDDGTVFAEKIEVENVTTENDQFKFSDLFTVKGLKLNEDTVTRKNCAIIFSPYGGCFKGNSYYLVAAEGKINEKNVELAGENEEKTNFVTLKVNGYTGRVVYYDYEEEK